MEIEAWRGEMGMNVTLKIILFIYRRAWACVCMGRVKTAFLGEEVQIFIKFEPNIFFAPSKPLLLRNDLLALTRPVFTIQGQINVFYKGALMHIFTFVIIRHHFTDTHESTRRYLMLSPRKLFIS